MKQASVGPRWSRALPSRLAVLLTVMALLVTAACGQKAGVYDPTAAPDALDGPADSGSFIVDPSTGEIIATSAEQLGAATSEAGAGTLQQAGMEASGQQDDTQDSLTRGLHDPAAMSQAPAGGSTAGVSNSVIKLGFHIPITGAAPVPPAAVPGAIEKYWDHLRAEGLDINGRYVEVVWHNDGYDATIARSKCQEMVERDQVFALVGFAGTHTIAACARYAAKVGVPYFTPGSSEPLLTGLPTYFGLSMTYIRQLPLVAHLLVSRFDARRKKNALVRPVGNVPGHFVSPAEAMEERGARFEVEHQVQTQADREEIELVVIDLKRRGIDNVMLVGSPDHFIYFTHEARKQGYRPQIVGPGITYGFDFFMNVACPNLQGGPDAYVLHPSPAYHDRDDFDPEFDQAGGTNEIEWVFWGLWEPIAKLLALPGRNLTRERLLWYTARAKNVATGVFPPISFSLDDHFGGTQMHLLRSECDETNARAEQPTYWRTEKAFFGLDD